MPHACYYFVEVVWQGQRLGGARPEIMAVRRIGARWADRAAMMYTLIQTAKLNGVDPQAWLADVLARIADTPQTQLADLLPWCWAEERGCDKLAA